MISSGNKGKQKTILPPGAMTMNKFDEPKQEAEKDDDDDDKQEDNGPTENLLQPGSKISMEDFQLVTVIGRGSFGKVFLAKKKSNGQPYAMKILKKDQLIKKNLLIKTQAERDILEKVKNPYIVGLHFAFQTETKLYFFIDFLNGGELFTYLRREQRFSEDRAKLYAAEMIHAIGALHERDIIYRDLKPENVILDGEGHIRITDFGLSKQGVKQSDRTYSFCGTPEYLAPEIIKASGHSWGADWWSLGAILYEMLSGRPPLYNRDRQQMLRDIVDESKVIPMRSYFSASATDLLQKLLTRDQSKRLGYANDAEELMAHPFFDDCDWQAIKEKTHTMPFKPKIKHAEDTSAIDKLFTKETVKETPVLANAMDPQQKQKAHFPGFTYQGNGAIRK